MLKPSTRRLRAFICYSSDDREAVRNLYHRLLKLRVSPWLDVEDLLPGQDWEAEIKRAIGRCDVIIVCVSATSVTKAGYVQREIEFALDIADAQPAGQIYLIPAKLEPCAVPERIARWHWVDLFDERGYERLAASLNKRSESISD
jgi:hypothetical protein